MFSSYPIHLRFRFICVSQAVSSLKVFFCLSGIYIYIFIYFSSLYPHSPFIGSFFKQRSDKWWSKNLRICPENTIRISDITVLGGLLQCLWHGWWHGLALDKLAGFLSSWQMNQRNPTLTFQFTEIGRQQWRNLTQRNLCSLKNGLSIGIINPLYFNVLDLSGLRVSNKLSVVYKIKPEDMMILWWHTYRSKKYWRHSKLPSYT